MDEIERQKYEAKSQELRAELKRFEGDWAKQNGGAKPGRQDIKQNPDIAQRYKKYNQVRDILAGKIPPPKPKDAPAKSRKRKPEETLQQTTPSKKRPVAAETPSKVGGSTDILDNDQYGTPAIRRLFSPAAPTSIGPTPQKDGRILGLFDLLAESTGRTPSKGKPGGDAVEQHSKIQATPSKRKLGEEESLCRTPGSARKRRTSDTFATPLKPRDGNAVTTPSGRKTPSSVSKLSFATPAFLRRAPLPSLDENGEFVDPAPLRLPRKPLGRSLSSVVASLRKMEEEQHDDDLDALREMEMEAEGMTPASVSVKKTAPKTDFKSSNGNNKDDILVPDSQNVPQLLGGFDDEALYDSPTEDQMGRDGQPLRIFKKKGQKRTTRRVNMKPTRTKRPDTQDSSATKDGDFVPETQIDPTAAYEPDADLLVDSDVGDGDDDDEYNDNAAGGSRKTRKPTTKQGEKRKKSGDGEGEGRIKKAAKKVNELAHANFKRLKLRNNGAKGGPGFGSRFRRRR